MYPSPPRLRVIVLVLLRLNLRVGVGTMDKLVLAVLIVAAVACFIGLYFAGGWASVIGAAIGAVILVALVVGLWWWLGGEA